MGLKPITTILVVSTYYNSGEQNQKISLAYHNIGVSQLIHHHHLVMLTITIHHNKLTKLHRWQFLEH
jgi:hypothetical protein